MWDLEKAAEKRVLMDDPDGFSSVAISTDGGDSPSAQMANG